MTTSLCKYEQWHVRRNAVGAVGELAPQGDEEALTMLRPLLGDSDSDVKKAAVAAISKIEGG
jgi:HEAT repeat protein